MNYLVLINVFACLLNVVIGLTFDSSANLWMAAMSGVVAFVVSVL